MSLTAFTRDIVPILQLVISIIGVGGLVLVWYQIRLSNMWNRASQQHQMLQNLPPEEHEKRVWKIFEAQEKDKNGYITAGAAELIYDDVDSWVCVKTFLNKFEHLCASISAGFIDDEYAYSVHSARVCDVYFKFSNYIRYARDLANDEDIYIELQKVAKRWRERTQEAEARRKHEEAILDQSRGTKAQLR